MDVNHTTKTITATNSELPMVQNYVEHLIAPSDRKNWKLNITDSTKVVEVRKSKKV